MLSVWSRLRDARVIGLRRSANDKDKARIVLYVTDVDVDEQTHGDLSILLETLGLRAGIKEFVISYGLVPNDPNEVAVLTVSILDLMLDLAIQVDAPQEHIDEGRTMPTFIDTGLGGPLFTVHSSLEEPELPYVAIRDRGYWFYIDDRDRVRLH